MREEFSAGDVGHQHVDIQAILKGGVEVDNEGMTDAREDISLRVDMLNLTQAHDLGFAEHLQGEAI